MQCSFTNEQGQSARGFWALSIKDEQQLPIANLSFGFLNPNAILIASVQGIKDDQRNILELNKRVTKESFGIRPQNLLVACMQALCQAWQIQNLIGIDPKNQVKRKINTARQGFRFDYVGFWTELGASKNFSGYWTLPTALPMRNLDEIPSHKRSQYRKRNDLLNQLLVNTTQFSQKAKRSDTHYCVKSTFVASFCSWQSPLPPTY